MFNHRLVSKETVLPCWCGSEALKFGIKHVVTGQMSTENAMKLTSRARSEALKFGIKHVVTGQMSTENAMKLISRA